MALVVLGGVLMTTACHEQKSAGPPPLPTNAVAVVGDQVITRESYQAELARRAQAALGRFKEADEKQALLEEMIRVEVLHQKALAAGYDKDPQIAASLKRMIVAKFQEDQLAKAGAAPVTAEELADFYRKNPQRFGTPEKVRAALIELKSARTATIEKRAEVAARAAAVLAEARTNAAPDHTFGLMAQRHSEHQPSRYGGGDIGWLPVGRTNTEWPAAVTEAIFQLQQPGDLSPVIETPTAFYVVKLVERQPAAMRPIEELKDGIEYLVRRQKEQAQRDELHATLKHGVNIQINQALLDSISVPNRESKPPGVPGGQ